MGLTYRNNANPDDVFDVNISGADMLGEIHKAAGTSLHPIHPAILMDDGDPDTTLRRVPYEATASEARAMAEAIRQTTLVDLAEVHERVTRWGFTSMDFTQFVAWVFGWVTFLERADGYKGD